MMFGFTRKKEKHHYQIAAVTEFSQAIKDKIMSQINQQITDMKEVIQSSITQAIMEELSLSEITAISNNAEGNLQLEKLKKRLSHRIGSIVTQQTVAAMDRLSKIANS
jgi:hypothetical protein